MKVADYEIERAGYEKLASASGMARRVAKIVRTLCWKDLYVNSFLENEGGLEARRSLATLRGSTPRNNACRHGAPFCNLLTCHLETASFQT